MKNLAAHLIGIYIHSRHADRRPQKVYRKLYDVQPTSSSRGHGYYASKDKPTHTARIRYQRKDLRVELIDGQWHGYP